MDENITTQKIKNLEEQINSKRAEHKAITKNIDSLRVEQSKLSQQLTSLQNQLDQLRSIDNFNKSEKESAFDWTSSNFEWHDRALNILQNTFMLKEFREKQLAAINATLSGKDVLLLMPTGGGKSLAYQLPALVDSGLTVVVSPLLSLIEDQLIALRGLGVEAAAMNSTTEKEEKKKIFNYMAKGGSDALRLLYVTPEWIAKSKMFVSYLQKCYAAKRLDRIAIDEVHCCSTWGHDFRPDYKFLGLLKGMFPNVPFIGLTATATISVLLDVQNMLDMQGCLILKAPFNRPNLFYSVVRKPATADDCYKYLENLLTGKYKNKSGIIYATTIKDCEELTKNLMERGLKVRHYHANLTAEQRSRTHRGWISGKYQAIIGTVAFGMGIDKPDVRFVIHHSMPKSMEGYYQESGRAGRDGQRADCILLYKFSDFFRNSAMVSSKTEEKNLYSFLDYCLNNYTCRRKQISKHFEEDWNSDQCNEMCDSCSEKAEITTYDITPLCRDVHRIIECAEEKSVNLTLLKLLDGWFQTGSKELRAPNLEKPKITREQAENVLAFMLAKGYLKEDKNYTAYAVNCYLQKKGSLDGERVTMPSVDSLRLKRLPT